MTRLVSLAALASIFTAACGSDTTPCATNQDEALACLGVPLDESNRVDTLGTALPASYSPLGPAAKVGASSEMLLVGMRIAPPVPIGEPTPLASRVVTVALADDVTRERGLGVLDIQAPGTASWETDDHSGHASNGNGARSTRAAAATDLDGDGVDERVVAFLDLDDPANAGAVFVQLVGAPAAATVAIVAGARDVAIVGLDSDGDGDGELAIAAAAADGVTIVVVDRDAAGNLAAIAAAERSYATVIGTADVSVELAAGNLDRDAGDELVAVVNEYQSTSGTATSRFRVIDDATGGYAELAPATAIRVEDGGSFEADVSDVAVGDFDADGRDEIVFGGLDELTSASCASFRHLYLALDDAGDVAMPLAPIAQRAEMVRYVPASGCDEVVVELPVHHVFVNALDVDADGVPEIQANLRVFDDLRSGSFVDEFALAADVLAGTDGRGGSALSPSTTAFEVGDVDGDGRHEIVVFAQHRDRIAVWGLDGASVETAIFREIVAVDTELYNSQTRVFPLIVPVDVDRDGVALAYSDVDHRVVFTEPVIIAAVAAAPCAEGIGQNLAACTTSYGLSTASSGGVDAAISISTSTFLSYEAKDPFLGIGVEGRASVTKTASFSASRSYSLTETVEYTTGPLEDTVIFTTVPLDQYRYTVISHPDPTLVGSAIVINLPRSPITLQVEREFYNRNVVEGSFQVGSNVFLHTPGDLASYPTEGDADALIATGGLAHLGPLGELVDAAGEALGPLAETLLGNGIKTSRAVTVGQGGGQTTTEIVFSEVTEYRAGFEIAFEAELAVTGGGVGVGTGIGGTLGAGLSWGTTSSTIYRGSIGSIDAENFAANRYDAGLFTYIFNYANPTAPQFEVINYWVARP